MLEDIIEALEKRQKQLTNEATTIVKSYWNWFVFENRRILDNKKVGIDAGKPLAQVAPVVENRKNGKDLNKTYIVWKQFSPRFRKNIDNPKASIALHKYSDLKPRGQYTKCRWERLKAEDTEQKLIPIRLELETIHEMLVRARAGNRKLSNHNHQGEAA